jgi:hypothetical protein
MKEALSSTELETKASRETIMRLVSEVGKEQKIATKYTSELDQLFYCYQPETVVLYYFRPFTKVQYQVLLPI